MKHRYPAAAFCIYMVTEVSCVNVEILSDARARCCELEACLEFTWLSHGKLSHLAPPPISISVTMFNVRHDDSTSIL